MSEQQHSAVGQRSQDGQLVWDGQQWRPIASFGWQPTSWTRPMQLAAGGYLIINSLISIATSLLFQQVIRDAALKSIQTSNPNLSPEAAHQAVNISVAFGVGLGIIFSILFLLLGVISIIRRWAWVFYVDLGLLALFSLGVIGSLLNLSNPNSPNPAGLTALNLVSGLIALALFAWLLVGRVQRGVWACTRVPNLV